MDINIEFEDYTFVEGQEEEQWTIRLKTGEYKDTFYQYGKIRVHESDTNDPVLKFSYKVLESNSNIEEISADEGFLNYISAVLQHILEDTFLDDTDNNTEELNTE